MPHVALHNFAQFEKTSEYLLKTLICSHTDWRLVAIDALAIDVFAKVDQHELRQYGQFHKALER